MSRYFKHLSIGSLHKGAGFTLPELMLSTAIMAMMTTMVVSDLRASKMSDELKTAVRVVSSDIRSARDRAIGGQNVKTCTSGATIAIAEESVSLCTDLSSLGYTIPSAVGLSMASGTSYDLFADVDHAPAYANGMQDGATERWMTRNLALSGTPNVVIDHITVDGSAVNRVSLAYARQSGTMMIDGVVNLLTPKTIVITMRQTQSNQTRTITVDQWSGRLKTDL